MEAINDQAKLEMAISVVIYSSAVIIAVVKKIMTEFEALEEA
jgi:hypothetical protein